MEPSDTKKLVKNLHSICEEAQSVSDMLFALIQERTDSAPNDPETQKLFPVAHRLLDLLRRVQIEEHRVALMEVAEKADIIREELAMRSNGEREKSEFLLPSDKIRGRITAEENAFLCEQFRKWLSRVCIVTGDKADRVYKPDLVSRLRDLRNELTPQEKGELDDLGIVRSATLQGRRFYAYISQRVALQTVHTDGAPTYIGLKMKEKNDVKNES